MALPSHPRFRIGVLHVISVAAALAALPVSVAQARCNRYIVEDHGAAAIYIARYRHVTCSTARAVARTFLPGARRGHLGFRCVTTPVQAGGGQKRCTKRRGKLVLLDFE